MKFKSEIVITELGEDYVAVPVGENVERYVVRMNKTGAEICGYIIDGMSEGAIIDKLLTDYEINREQAEKAVKDVIDKLREEDLLEG